MDRVPMTKAGHAALVAELKKLKSVDRPRNVKDIEEALDHGDLKENAEYKYAKEKQGFIQGRIQEIDDKLARAEVIELTSAPGKVTFGCQVVVVDAETDEEQMFIIVGQDELDIKLRKISYESPIARALLQKAVGDLVEVNAPRGVRELEIVSIEIPSKQ